MPKDSQQNSPPIWGGGSPIFAARKSGQSPRCSVTAPKQQRLDVSEVGDVTIVRFRDRRITEGRRIQQMAEELFHLVEGDGRNKLLVSLSSVDFMSSAALGKLITLEKKAKARGSMLKLCNVCPQLSLVLAVTRLDRLFDIETDEAHALAAF